MILEKTIKEASQLLKNKNIISHELNHKNLILLVIAQLDFLL